MATAGIFCSATRLHQLADFARAVEQGVIGMAMEMDEGRFGHGAAFRDVSGEAPPSIRGRRRWWLKPLRGLFVLFLFSEIAGFVREFCILFPDLFRLAAENSPTYQDRAA